MVFAVRKFAYLLGAGAISSVACSSPLQAADVFFSDMPLVLTASRMAQSPLDAPVAVTIIDRQMIKASGFTEIHDLLRLVPGFLVADWPKGSPVVARHGLADAYDRRIKVMIDGRTVNRSLRGDTAWQDLPIRVEDIDRIEVVRGAHGAAYGVNAFDGVINIITRSPLTEDGFSLVSQVGQGGLVDVAFRGNGLTAAGIDWRLSASQRKAENFRPRFDDRTRVPTEAEQVRNTLVSFSATQQITASDEINLHLAVNEGSAERGNDLDLAEPLRDEETRSQFFHLSWLRSLGADAELALHLSHQAERFRAGWVRRTPPLIPIDMNTDGQRDEIELQYTARLAPAWRTLIGVGVRRESVESVHYFNADHALKGSSSQLFGTLTWDATPKLKLDMGATLEDHYFSGTLLSPRLSANYALNEASVVRVSSGISYRAPSFFESSAEEVIRVGDKVKWVGVRTFDTVEPERVEHVEIGYVAHWREIGLGLDVRAFHERYSRYLDSRSCFVYQANCPPPANYEPFPYPFDRPPKQFRFVNSAALTRHGAEFSLDWRRPGVGRVILSTAVIDIDAKAGASDGDFELSAPSTISSLLLIKEFAQRWTASAGFYYQGDMYWLNDGDRVADTRRLDLRLARAFGRPGANNEIAIVAQSVNGRYPEFYERKYRHEPRLHLSLSLGW